METQTQTPERLSLPKKLTIALACLVLSPLIVVAGTLTFLSFFPFLLLGRFEGDLGHAPLTREVKRLAQEQHARTERRYATA